MTFLFALFLYPLHAPAPAQTPNDLSISVQIRTVPLSGRGFGTAGSNRGDEVIARVTADENFCVAGAGSLAHPHAYAWELSGRIVSRTADTVTADVAWKQLEGPGAGGAAKTRTVTLKRGERVTLETIRPAGNTPCAAEGQLEVEAGSRVPFIFPMIAGVPGPRASGTGASSGTSSGTSSGGGGRGGAAAAKSGGGGFSLRDPAGVPATLPPGAPFNVEIWLIRTLPNGTERVEAHDRADNVSLVAKKFGPVSVATPAGNVSVTVGVDLRTFARATDPLAILINRDEGIDNKTDQGGTSRVSAVPGDTEIISLELPQSSRYADRFSVRLKFTKPGNE